MTKRSQIEDSKLSLAFLEGYRELGLCACSALTGATGKVDDEKKDLGKKMSTITEISTTASYQPKQLPYSSLVPFLPLFRSFPVVYPLPVPLPKKQIDEIRKSAFVNFQTILAS